MRPVSLALVITLALPVIAFSQASKPHDDQDAAIRAAVNLYMSADPAKVREAFSPVANLYTADDKGELRVIPLDQFLTNVAKGAAAGQPRPASSVDFIDHVGNAATVKLTETSPTARITDYFSLVKGNSGWKVVSKTFNVDRMPAAATETKGSANSCPSAEIPAFDFMLGNWITSDPTTPTGAPANGTSRTEKILDGCVLLEHRYLEQNGKKLFDAEVAWAYDVTTSRMLLFYWDNLSHAQLYQGRRENGGWAFYRERPNPDGTIMQIRVTYAAKGKGFEQSIQRSKDHGKTWEAPTSTSYEPKP